MDIDEKCSLVKFQFGEKEDSILKKINAQGKCVTHRNLCGKLKLLKLKLITR